MTKPSIYYSVVIPVFNEEDSIKPLHKEIVSVMKTIGKPYEIIIVNDASTDKTLNIIKKLKPITIIDLRKNSGQSSALDAGIKHAMGKIIITMDGDGQNNPNDIPKLLKKMDEGYDVVCGWRKKRKDSFSKRFISAGARNFRRILVADAVHDAGCTLRVYKRECFQDLDLYGELHRMIPAMLRWRGFSLSEISVNHRPRKYGRSKYDWKRTVRGLVDMVNIWFWRKYESRPLHLFGSLGIIISSVSILGAVILVVAKIFYHYSLSDKIWPLVAVTGFITGLQVFIFGILADMIIKNRPTKIFYNIKDIIKR